MNSPSESAEELLQEPCDGDGKMIHCQPDKLQNLHENLKEKKMVIKL